MADLIDLQHPDLDGRIRVRQWQVDVYKQSGWVEAPPAPPAPRRARRKTTADPEGPTSPTDTTTEPARVRSDNG